jgi:tetratricopeptide (TPR) repeat protein
MRFWLYREAKSDGIQKLFFLSREGLIMKRVFDVLFPFDKYGIATDYLYCSRRSVRVPLIRTKFDLLQPVYRPIFRRSINSWFEINYGIELGESEFNILQKYGYQSRNAIINNNINREKLAELVIELSDKLMAISNEERSILIHYLNHKKVGFDADAIVDIGYAGTIQEAISCLCGKRLKGYYLATFSTTARYVKNQFNSKGFLLENSADDNPRLGICTHRYIYESLICSNEDSVIKIKKTSDGFTPIKYKLDTDSTRKYFINNLHSGIVDLAKEYKEKSPIAPENSILSPEASVLQFDLYLYDPMPKDIELLYGISYSDLYGIKNTKYLAITPEMQIYLQPNQIIWKESLKISKQNKNTIVNFNDQRNSNEVFENDNSNSLKIIEINAKKYFKNRQYTEAAENFIKAFELSPCCPNYLRSAAEAYFKSGNRDIALITLAKFNKIRPDNKKAKLRRWVMRYPFLSVFFPESEFIIN